MQTLLVKSYDVNTSLRLLSTAIDGMGCSYVLTRAQLTPELARIIGVMIDRLPTGRLFALESKFFKPPFRGSHNVECKLDIVEIESNGSIQSHLALIITRVLELEDGTQFLTQLKAGEQHLFDEDSGVSRPRIITANSNSTDVAS